MSSTQTDAPSGSGPTITTMSVPTLTAMVVGGMVGAGVFPCPGAGTRKGT